MIDKTSLLESLRIRVRGDFEALERRQRDTQDGATHEENRAEHAKDTRATEQSYLARGLADRVIDLQRTLDALESLELPTFGDDDPVAVGALVVITSDGDGEGSHVQHDPPRSESWFVVPGGGGLEFEASGQRIRTLTPVSPLGRSLLGLCRGDEGNLVTPRGRRAFEVLEVG